jgi:hypothetical protein
LEQELETVIRKAISISPSHEAIYSDPVVSQAAALVVAEQAEVPMRTTAASERSRVVAVGSNRTLYIIIHHSGSLIMRVSLFAAALLLAACTPPPPPGAAPAHAPRALGELDVARIYAAVGYGESLPGQRVGLSRRRIKDWNLGEDGFLSDSVVSRLLDWGLFSVVCEDVERGTAPECAPHGLMFSRPRRVNRDTVDVYMGPVRGGIPLANWRITRCRLAYAAGRWRTTECETTVLI